MNALVALVLCLQETEAPAPRPEPPKAQEKEVVVIGQRREADVLDVPSAVTVVTGEQIRKSGATNVVEVLQRQPGFFAQGQNKGAYDQVMDIRGYNNGGGNGQRTLILLDGRKMNGSAGGYADWASIPLGNVERIEIVRGPAASLYGDGALAGVINIITRKGGKEFSTEASASGGNWGTFAAAVNAGGAVDSALFEAFARAEGTSGWRDHGGYQGQDFSGRFETPLTGSLRLFAKVGHHRDERERPGSLTRAEMALYGRNGSVRRGDAEMEETSLDSGLTQTLGGLGELSLFASQSWREGSQFDGEFSSQIDDSSRISMLQLKHVVAPKPFGREATLTTGVDLQHEWAGADSSAPWGDMASEYRRRLLGLFHHAEFRPLPEIILSASLRYDRALLDLDRDDSSGMAGVDEQRAFDQFSPQAGVTVKPVDSLSLYASWGRTFKYPTRDELVGFFSTDPWLDPERARVYEAGARFWSAPWGSASVTFFRMEVQDEIYYDPFFAPWGANINFDEVVHRGIESEGRVTPFDWLEVFATHTYTRAVITRSENPGMEGKDYPVTPRVAGTAGVVFRVEGASLTLSGRYSGDRYLINDLTNGLEKLDPYLVYDAKLSYTYKSVTGFASVFNVTDREYYDSGGASGRYNPAPERSWLLGGEVRF